MTVNGATPGDRRHAGGGKAPAPAGEGGDCGKHCRADDTTDQAPPPAGSPVRAPDGGAETRASRAVRHLASRPTRSHRREGAAEGARRAEPLPPRRPRCLSRLCGRRRARAARRTGPRGSAGTVRAQAFPDAEHADEQADAGGRQTQIGLQASAAPGGAPRSRTARRTRRPSSWTAGLRPRTARVCHSPRMQLSRARRA